MGFLPMLGLYHLVPKYAELGVLLGGEGAVMGGVLDSLGPAVGDGLGDVVLGGPSAGRDGLESTPEGGLVEAGGAGGLGGQLGHLPHALGVQVTALAVLFSEEAGGRFPGRPLRPPRESGPGP